MKPIGANKEKNLLGKQANTSWHAEFVKALDDCQGVLQQACRVVGISYFTMRDHRALDPEFRQQVADVIIKHGRQAHNGVVFATPFASEMDTSWHPLFLAFLEETGNLTESCRQSGVPKDTMRDHRAKIPAFEQQVQEALETAKENIHLAVRSRWEDREVLVKEIVHPDGRVEREYKVIQGNDVMLIFDAKRIDPTYRDNYQINIQNNQGQFTVSEQDGPKVLPKLQEWRAQLRQESTGIALSAPSEAHGGADALAKSDTEWAGDAESDEEFPWES